jgi:hypothetical protein
VSVGYVPWQAGGVLLFILCLTSPEQTSLLLPHSRIQQQSSSFIALLAVVGKSNADAEHTLSESCVAVTGLSLWMRGQLTS